MKKSLFWDILGPFCPIWAKCEFFSKKLGSATFTPLWTRDFMQKKPEKSKSILRKECYTDMSEFIAHSDIGGCNQLIPCTVTGLKIYRFIGENP